MTRAQQIQVLARLRDLQAILATVDYSHAAKDANRAPAYILGYCHSLVERTLEEAGEKSDK